MCIFTFFKFRTYQVDKTLGFMFQFSQCCFSVSLDLHVFIFHTMLHFKVQTALSWRVFLGYLCVFVRRSSSCGGRFLSVVHGSKVGSSAVTFSPSQDLLCLTTAV